MKDGVKHAWKLSLTHKTFFGDAPNLHFLNTSSPLLGTSLKRRQGTEKKAIKVEYVNTN